MSVVRYADRQDLHERRYQELSEPVWPKYLTNREVGDLYWDRLYKAFADFQVALLDARSSS
ncbi:MAG: hypothetical protein ACRDOF_02170, partial [Gaiellaceae bacterium]